LVYRFFASRELHKPLGSHNSARRTWCRSPSHFQRARSVKLRDIADMRKVIQPQMFSPPLCLCGQGQLCRSGLAAAPPRLPGSVFCEKVGKPVTDYRRGLEYRSAGYVWQDRWHFDERCPLYPTRDFAIRQDRPPERRYVRAACLAPDNAARAMSPLGGNRTLPAQRRVLSASVH